MESYIATFYAHFGAIRYVRTLEQHGIKGKMMPVPRSLSSSCGTCVFFSSDQGYEKDTHGEIEQIVRVLPDGYEMLYHADEE